MWVSECTQYLEERVFVNKSTQPSDLHERIREYLEKRKQNPEAAELLAVLDIDRIQNTSEFLRSAKDVAFLALKWMRESFGLTTMHLKKQLEFSREPPLHPSSACANLNSPSHVFLLLQEERRRNVVLFLAAVPPYNELVSAFSKVDLPLKKIDNPSDAVEDLRLIDSPLMPTEGMISGAPGGSSSTVERSHSGLRVELPKDVRAPAGTPRSPANAPVPQSQTSHNVASNLDVVAPVNLSVMDWLNKVEKHRK
ncbi:hypothetical protein CAUPRSCDRAFT_12757 [Caulochytrium protostelioides]|uniref:Uncharacterized protein n=1 Tax=Caulochytrium protostelioides TaxID=1555241 RepID=A0A4P9WR56_9FUNG|nr:hypothetical protein CAUPRSCDRAFT_12757 [Caulochytrium protostelioides]